MTTLENPPTANLGVARLRKEDAHLVTGKTRWTDNIRVPGMLHASFVRSPMAHARVVSVDVSAAKEQPGVVAVYTGADLQQYWESGLPCAWPVTENMRTPLHLPLATDEVRYVGDAVAVVVATDRYLAADAVEYVDVEYDPLPVVTDMEAALAEGADLADTTLDSNECFVWPLENGDVDAAFDGAAHVVTRRFIQQRLLPTAIEPRAVVAAPPADQRQYTVWSATQVPHILRLMLALTCGVPEHELRVVAPDVGGGFGSKLNVYAEEAVCLVLARLLDRAVKWTETRSENYQATIHGRDQIQDLSLALDEDGRIRGLKVDLKADMGAYLQLVTPGIPLLGAFMYNAIYKMDALSFRCTGVFTNKTPTDAYRGAGRPEATFAIERLIDEAAVELGMDPMALRERNWIQHEEFPYETIAGLTYDSGNYEAATARAKELFGYDELRAEQARRRESGDQVQLGIGISTYTEMCGLAPSRVLGSLSFGAGGWETASVRMLPSGKVEVITGTSPHGQGHVTSWSQIAADALGIPYEDIEVHHGDTAVSHRGLDTYGSRSLVVGGYAVRVACDKVVAKAKRIAAHLLEASEDDLEFDAGTFSVRGSPDVSTSLQDLALAVFTSHDYPEGIEPSLDADATVDPENFSYPHGTHLAAVEVDTETGSVHLRDYVAVDDVGKVVNPQIVEGQVHGGLAQGIAQALFEEAIHDDEGNLVTGTLVDYYVPSAADLPTFRTDRTETPATTNPLGVKGVGEAGAIASTPAVMNAVIDALRPLGVKEVPMPASPQNVWQAIRAARDGGGGGGGAGASTGTTEGGAA
ncbi:xanthine dehydrogenase family protein molybdopterin-binding subunit [Egicoccus sp. AB-alg2]|uniref:xanthine dehydrogenase family protein molybdopterin-binding subunit n=1 Tax=Egicoccus sp. AB-alg2 TaxID=3242693 RepID=UPI00359E4AC2